ncbi:unnamed protein product [Litomosoides sigmodontis]|uniref:Uncharacterized protein n=1 Tax=Litomosoides sigmodontis TaxID=42156 RepID=A0A3P7K414_LITSI|nr:unnamed protein product [Litomosoides sigmodontis]
MDSFWLANCSWDSGEADDSSSNHYFHELVNRLKFFQQKARYLEELILELQQLNEIKIRSPRLLLRADALLTAELNKVWNLLCNKQDDDQMGSSGNEWQSKIEEEESVTLQEKIMFSKEQSCYYVRKARNLRSILLKRLENETNCQILIRGRGSLLDRRLEFRLKNYAGWEHLLEPLHLLVRANDSTIALCAMKLASGVRHIKKYFMMKHFIDGNKMRGER